MKKVKVSVFVGVFIILTSVICFSEEESVYKKKVHFDSPKEIIDVLNTKNLSAYSGEGNHYGRLVNTDDYKECLSKRKRTTKTVDYFKNLDLTVDESYDEEEIIEEYKKVTQNLNNYKIGDNLKAYYLKGKCSDYHKISGTIEIKVVFCDEGEGFVIDYMNYTTKMDDEKNSL
ncbi:hypothetical protein SAMN04487886_11093 [Clostridium sp. DSM 8431]|uniref:hypothetical protein n=1 Tax=Clostridium sp. DSM 8431 TaxID=1761781 RepID=UPI0008E51258|nr:hypothetical protein [Clostridium sp. DSM 8431]SFU70320.1 hypothetical protein SAMN04487886_11093 [Clostridium sp. DSM 8431]